MLKYTIYLFFILILGFLLLGNIYYWTDKDGTKHYSNIAPPLNGKTKEMEENSSVLQAITASKNQKQIFKVLKIYDGDTIQISGLDLIFKVRLVGIDSPEIGYKGQLSQAYSQKSKKYLSTLLKKKKITLKSYGLGGYGRQLAEIFVDDKNINIELIKAGLTEVYKGKQSKTLDTQRYLKEEKKAKSSKLGMWAQGSTYISPMKWRRDHPRK